MTRPPQRIEPAVDQATGVSKSESVQETVTATSRAQEMLLEFLREHDAACPVCGYNLRAVTRPTCPECGHELVLTVGTVQPRLGWLLAAVAPGFFSGITATFLLVPIIGRLAFGDGQMSPALNAVDVFGLCSGLFAIVIAKHRLRFIAQSRARQQWWTLTIWLVHIAALALFILLGSRYL